MDSSTVSWGCCLNDNTKSSKPFINCVKCNRSYHFVCLSICEITSDSDAYCKWYCSDCTSLISNSSKKESTPSRNVTITRGNKRPALNSPPHTTAVTTEDVRSIVQEVIKAEFASMLQQITDTILNVVNKELEPIRHDIRELSTSLSFHTKEFKEFQSEHNALKTSVKDLENENSELINSVADLILRVNYLEQQTRSSNLEVQCLPENKQENLYTVVKQLGSVVGCELNESDIHHCTRVAKLQATSTRPRSVVVQLASPKIRDQLLASVINYNKNKDNTLKLNSADLGIAGEKSPVFVLDHLSPSNKALHAATRLKAKDKGYRFVWVRNGRIFVWKNETADHILIRNLDSLNKLI